MTTATATRVLPTVPNLLKLAWPIIVSRCTQVIVGLSDALMVAHLGETALAATTAGAMNVMALFILPMGTVFIVGTFTSQHVGSGDPTGARRFAWYGVGLAAFTQVLALVSLSWLGKALGLFSFTPEVQAALQEYLAIRLLAGGAVVGLEALASYYGGLGNTRRPMVANLAAMGLNLLGNWVLIDGRWGAPALGVGGAALASTVATTLAFAGLLGGFLLDGRRQGTWLPRLKWAELWKMLRYGLPSGLNWFFEFFAFLFFVNVVVAGLGTTSLAAMMAVLNLNSVAFMPSFALASAGAIVVGQAIGAGAKEDVPKSVWRTFLLAFGWQGAVGLFYLAAPKLAFSPFVREQSTPQLLEVGARMLALSALWQIFDAAATTLAEALRAAGDTAFTLWARLALAWLVFVPGSWYAVRSAEGEGTGEVQAMFWLSGYLAGLALLLLARFRSGAWQKFTLVEPSLAS